MREHIFSGIYPDFAVADLQSYGEGFDSEEAVARAVQKLQEARTSPKSNIPIGLRTCSLPAFIAAQNSHLRPLSILDFGGSVGFGYWTLLQSAPNVKIEKYDIVEGQRLCQAGSELFADLDTPVRFHARISEDCSWDWAYVNSTIQYIDDYPDLLRSLLNCCDWILLDDVPAGSNPDFVSIQRYYSSTVPHRFFCESNLTKLFAELGLNIHYQGIYFGSILGKIDGYPMDNFPASHRITFSRTYLLETQRRISVR